MLAWVLRFGLFGTGNPGAGLWMLLLSNIVYGMAFDFFNISGSLYVEQNTNSGIRASAQGVFMIMTNGIGAIVGSYAAGYVVKHYTSTQEVAGAMVEVTNWPNAWFTFAAYMVVVAVLFALIFKYKHTPEAVSKK